MSFKSAPLLPGDVIQICTTTARWCHSNLHHYCQVMSFKSAPLLPGDVIQICTTTARWCHSNLHHYCQVMSFKSAPLLPGDVIQICTTTARWCHSNLHHYCQVMSFKSFTISSFLPYVHNWAIYENRRVKCSQKGAFACPSIQPILQTVERNPVFNITRLVELGRKKELVCKSLL